MSRGSLIFLKREILTPKSLRQREGYLISNPGSALTKVSILPPGSAVKHTDVDPEPDRRPAIHVPAVRTARGGKNDKSEWCAGSCGCLHQSTDSSPATIWTLTWSAKPDMVWQLHVYPDVPAVQRLTKARSSTGHRQCSKYPNPSALLRSHTLHKQFPCAILTELSHHPQSILRPQYT